MSDRDLGRLARAVADGESIDWERELALASPATRPLLERLREIAVHSRGNTGTDEALPTSPADTAEPLTWGPLEVIERVSAGAYGTVFRARDTRLDRQVALKLLHGSGDSPAALVEEARLLARVRHPNVVDVYGADTFDGRAGIWMEFVHGRTFQQIVTDDGPLSAHEAGMIAIEVCLSLAAVHAAGLVHRDVSARNVMRETGGRIVLLDFGSVHGGDPLSGPRFVGTPLYLAPELLDGSAPPSVATDIYAAGVLLFFLVTSTFPVLGRSLGDLRAAHAAGAARLLSDTRPELPLRFAAVVTRALASRSADRFASASEMAQALAAAVAPSQDLHALASPHSLSAPLPVRRSRTVPLWFAVGSVVVAVALAFVAGRWSQAAPPPAASSAGPTLTAEQWSALSGYLDLAGERGETAHWDDAAALYARAADLMQDTLGVDAPQRSVVLAQRAWALSAAGRTDEARTWYDLAVYKLRQEAGPVHPYVITLELARAQHLLAAGLRHEAEGALRRALSEQREVLRAVGVTSAPWSPAEPLLDERTNRIDEDADGDWLLDVFERAARLDPTRADTDGDGVTDDEGDADGDGIPNGLAWPYGADPRKVVGHFGAVDPDRFGFRRERAFVARRVAPGGTIGAAWQVDAEPMGFYFARLTNAQKSAAFTRGFRLRARMALWEGNAFVNLDLVPVASRFDLNAFIQPPSRASVILMTSSMPRAGEWVDHGERGALPLIEFAFDPRAGTARYLVDGRTVRTDYAGYRQYQEDFGVFWGTTNDVGTAPRGLADFSLAWLTIR